MSVWQCTRGDTEYRTRIQNRGMHEKQSKRDNCVALTSHVFIVLGMSEDDREQQKCLGCGCL